jgi:two-component system chemotaxis sensor kinase CheA
MEELTREFLIESQEGLNRMERCLTELEQHPGDAALLAEIFRSVHTIKGTTGFLGYKRLEKLAHAGENLLALLRDQKLHADTDVITALLQLLDRLRLILRAIETDESEGDGDERRLIHRLKELQSPALDDVRLDTPAAAKAKPHRSRSHAPHLPVATPTPPPLILAEQPGAKSTALAADTTLRVDITLLDRLMNLVAELVLTRNQILQATATIPALASLSRRLDLITADLRESVMKARMQPLSHLFDHLPRLVRDLCHSLGRQVRLEIEGQETELDRSVLEAIKDPLTHAVRNAIDHGIEPHDLRVAAGKNPEGTLSIHARQEGSQVILEVSDDGAGISVDRIRKRALERNLISAEHAQKQSERELLQLIFLPGFSTASAVTTISGRGVGMDVIRTNVEKIGGKIALESQPGRGTTLRFSIPLTLAILPALIVRSAGQCFALPQAPLTELVHIPAENAEPPIDWIEDVPLYRLRGKLLPLVFLDQVLDQILAQTLSPASRRPDDLRDRYIAVLEAHGRCFGLVVDAVGDFEEIVIKPLHPVLNEIAIYSGAAVLGSGSIALVLDPAAIALRAGITLTDEQRDRAEGLDTDANKTEHLLIDIAGRRSAVLLESVVRIEHVPISRIEYIDAQPFLNFNGQLLAVDDPAGLLAEAESNRQLSVVICRDDDRHVGVVVSHLLDVAARSDLFDAGSGRGAEGLVLLKDHLATVVDLAQIPPAPDVPVDTVAASAVEVPS